MLLLVAGSGLALAALALREAATVTLVESDAGTAAVGSNDAAPPLVLRTEATAKLEQPRSRLTNDSEPAREPQLAKPTAQLLVRVDAEPERARRVCLVMTETSRATPTVIESQRTDEGGETRFAPCKTSDTTAAVDFGFPTCGAYAQPIDATTRATTLVLPELGMLRLRVVEGEDSPLTQPATAEVRVLDAIPPATRTHIQLLADGQGCLVVEAAALDLEVRITTADGRVSQPVRVRGPAVVGGDSQCCIKLPAPRILRARLLDGRGQVLAQAKVAVHVEGSGARLAGDVIADQQGVVAFRAPASPGRGRNLGLMFLAHDATDRPWQGRAFVDLQPDASPMLGDVFLHEPPTIVAGVCVDRDGLPRSDVVLRLQAEQSMATDKSGRRTDAWVDLPFAPVICQADGRFCALGNAPPDCRLRLIALGQNVPPHVFEAGAANVRVVLPGRIGWPGARP